MDELAITGVKQSSNFASKVPRFKENKKTNLNLGPGRYVPNDSWMRDSKKMPKTEFKPVEWQRTPNPPSIPSHDNVFGYEETKTGDLKRQKNPEKITSGVKQDIVGPGHYNVSESLNKNQKGIVKWKKNKSKRFKQKSNKQPSLGPGHYQVEKTEIFPIYKYKPTSVFASRVERATSVQVKKRQRNNLPVGRTRPITAYQNVIRQHTDFVGADLESDDDGDNPGPGYYNSHTALTAFNPKHVPQRQQFFGSTVARFDDKQKSKAKVGPGSYNYEAPSTATGTRASSQYQNRRPGFSSSGQRFEPKRAIEEPGPGTYVIANPEAQKENKRFVASTKNRAFGTTERRFVDGKTGSTPGPGEYKSESNLNQIEKRGGQNSKAKSSVFLSNVERNPYDQKSKKNKEPAVGAYDLKNHTIEENIKKKAGIGFENPSLINLKAKTKSSIPFSSNARRFDDKVDETDAWLAPGYYEHKASFDDNKGRQNKNQTNQFTKNSERFDKVRSIETPGPGYYNKDEASSQWFKKSFNMIFHA